MAKRVLVIGGGPAGSTAAGLLAKSGMEVQIFDRDRFPRYHIGESIVPACMPVLELLGLRERVESYGFVRKSGVHFRWGGRRWSYAFGSLTGGYTYAWQVHRSEFDHLLLTRAAALGASVFEGRRVTALHTDDSGRPHAVDWIEGRSGARGRQEFDYLVDASGRAGFLATRHLSGRRHHESFKNVAFWRYFKGGGWLPEAPRGATIVSSIRDGWVWVIPLQGDVLSIGVVMHKNRYADLRGELHTREVYEAALKEASGLGGILEGAEPSSDIRVEQDYSYTTDTFAGPGFYLAGDSACFLDPLLSTGVHLAMFSAVLAAAGINSTERGLLSEQDAATFYDDSYRRTYLRFLAIVAAVYKQEQPIDSYYAAAQDLTVNDAPPDEMYDAFLHVVSGVEDLVDVQGRDRLDGVINRVGDLYFDVHERMQERLRAEQVTPADREQALAVAGYWKSLIGVHTIDEKQAVDGMFVDTDDLVIRRVAP